MERNGSAPHGYLALVLHAHLPYVRHPEHPEFLEEDWLYEAITEKPGALAYELRREGNSCVETPLPTRSL